MSDSKKVSNIKEQLKDITYAIFTEALERKIEFTPDLNGIINSVLSNYGISKEEGFIYLTGVEDDVKRAKKIIETSKHCIERIEQNVESTILAIERKNLSEVALLKEELHKISVQIKMLSRELFTDELTKTYNRKWMFTEFLEKEKYLPFNGAFVFIDLNDFKGINDEFGHHVGDNALTYFVNHLNNELMHSNIEFKLIRFAGDEFILFLKDVTHTVAENNMALIEKDLVTKKFKPANKDKDRFFKLSFSYGVKMFLKGESIEDILKDADNGMYLMKSIRKAKR